MRSALLLSALLVSVAPLYASAQSTGSGDTAASGDAAASGDSEPAPTLASPPQLHQLIEPELPEGTDFPSDTVEVIVAIQVTATGTVAGVRLLEGVGAPFDAACVAAAEKFTFDPAKLTTGDAVPVTVNFRFRVNAPPPPPPPPPPPVTVKGRLLEKGRRRPIAFAPILARQGDVLLTESVTLEDGRFEIEVATSTFTLVSLPATHERYSEQIDAEPGEAVELETAYLLRVSPDQYETIVRGKSIEREVSKQTLDKEFIRKVPGTQGDTIKVIQNLPGVARAPFGGAPVVLRGASPGDSRTFLEGQEIPAIYHFGGLRSTFNSAFLEAVDFIPGNFGAEYGRATGGIVDVRTRDPSDDLFRGEVDLNFYDAGFALEGPITDELSIGGSFHRSWIDTLLPAVIPDDANVSFDTAPRYYDYQLLATWKPEKDHKLRAIYYGSTDRLQALFDNPGGDPILRGTLSSRVMFHNIFLSSEAQVTPRLKELTSVQTGYQELKFNLGPEFFFDLNVFRVSLRSHWDYTVNQNINVRLGTDSRVQFVDIALSAPEPPKEGDNPVPPSTLDPLATAESGTVLEPSLFLEVSWRLNRLRLIPSVRVDYYEAIDTATVDPRLLADFELFEDTSLRAGFGLYQQQPQYDESSAETGNPNLGSEKSIQASVGVTQQFTPGLSLELTGFYKWLDDQVVRNPELASNPTAVLYTNDGTGRIFGIESLLKFEIPQTLTGWVAYTFQRSFRTDGPEQEERVFDFDQPHILTALATWEIGSGWSLGARFRLVSGNPFSPVESSIYDAYTDVYVPQFAVEKDRLGTFHQLDIRIDKVWTFDTWELDLYLDIQNVYNQANPEGVSYSFDYSERDFVTGLPFLPILGLRGSW